MQESASHALQRIIGMNEETKKIIGLARQINIMALNAIITARRAGKAARGFSVLSTELRSFTGKLEQTMTHLRSIMSQAVDAVSAILKQDRLRQTLIRAQSEIQRAVSIMDQAVERGQRVSEQNERTLVKALSDLTTTIRKARQLADRGRMLARNAKIEAIYGGEYGDGLSQVASSFEDTIERVIATLAAFEQ